MITLKIKSESALMRFLGFFAGHEFMTSFCTTIGNTIYVPSKEWAVAKPNLLAHEIVHVWQKTRYFFYMLMYLTFWRRAFEAQAYAVQVWYRNAFMDGADKAAEWKRLTDAYFVPFGIYLFLTGKKPEYVEPSDELKAFISANIKEAIEKTTELC